MKKWLASLLALSLLAALSIPALAAEEIDQDGPQSGTAVITTSISPTYLVRIPDDTSVAFNATETSFGRIEVLSAQIEPGKQIRVALDTADGGLALVNRSDERKTIPYTVRAGSEPFTSGVYTKAGEMTDLTIHIRQADWNTAYAGEYTDTVRFTVSYEAAS